MSFPKEFVWGAASAAYQVEGAAFDDGKGLSVWDVFCRKDGAINKGETGDIACDHYHRYREDIALMKEIGLRAYRLSVSWPRVIPAGAGSVNPKGLEFYDRLVDQLLSAGIAPWVTLFHWDYPYDLYCRGGWLNPESPKWFGDYANVVVSRLSDRVSNWITVNEPQVFVGLGHGSGMHAPGIQVGLRENLQIIHNVHRAHGEAVRVIRAVSKQPCKIGIAPAASSKVPSSDDPRDVEATRTGMFTVSGRGTWLLSWWLDPLFLGHYPPEGVALMNEVMPRNFEKDMSGICQPLDFLGVNIYYAQRTAVGGEGRARVVPFGPGYPRTAFGWNVIPEALYWIPRFLWERYRSPIVVTENGLSNQDWIALDGTVRDPQRIDFVQRYLSELRRAGDDGVDIRGYFYWSILDNFEWAEGYKERFGLIYVDYPTQRRILKDSARWYRECIEQNGANIPRGNARFS